MKLQKRFLAAGIAIIFVIFIGYALYVFYPPPKYYDEEPNTCYEDFACHAMFDTCYNETAQLEETQGKPLRYDNSCYQEIEASAAYKECQRNLDTCQENYQSTTQGYKHARASFIILILIGLSGIGASMFIRLDAVSSGILGGGILTIIWSLMYTTQYWLLASKYVKLFLIAIVLGLLIYLGIRKRW